MTYELAKKLKDAGFPQVGKGEEVVWVDKGAHSAYIPTLSELIEACGDKFLSLNKDSSVRGGWSALSITSIKPKLISGGYTPEEAVAYLWLALNKK